MTATRRAARPGIFAGLAAARPRLMATKSAIARTQGLLLRNPTLRQWQGQIVRLADLMLELPPLTPNSVLDPRETEATPLPLGRARLRRGRLGRRTSGVPDRPGLRPYR